MLKRCFSLKNVLIVQNAKYSSKAMSKPFEVEMEKEWNVDEFLFDNEWRSILKDEFKKIYFTEINKKLKEDYKKHTIFPSKDVIFHAFNLTKLSQIKVVILGQDPYHNGQANGLAFSVLKGTRLPPSLRNVFTELKNDIPDFEHSEKNGCLEKWAKNEGVFLMNSFLTVEAHKASSHSKYGWHIFTDKVIRIISEKRDGCVFMLWGEHAKKKAELIDSNRHKIIKCAHPSPLSSHGFFNSKCFSIANAYLKSMGKSTVNWSLK